jgi:hypothetical protein
MPSPHRTERERSELLRLAASVRLESRLLREAAEEARDRSQLTCTRSQMIQDRCKPALVELQRSNEVAGNGRPAVVVSKVAQ